VLVPLFDTQRHETVDARVRTIGHVEGAATQVPRQPGIDGGESEFARSSSRVIYEPARLGRRLIGCQAQTFACKTKQSITVRRSATRWRDPPVRPSPDRRQSWSRADW